MILMVQWIDNLPWSLVLIAAVLLGLAPFHPQPHLVEKLRMLNDHTLNRPIDIFDLLYHALPVILLLIKVARTLIRKKR